MTEVSLTVSLDLQNELLKVKESQKRHKEPTPKNIQAEDRRSNNKMMKMLKYMKSEIASLKKKHETLAFSNPPTLRKFTRLLDLSNYDMESKTLTTVYTSKIKSSPKK